MSSRNYRFPAFRTLLQWAPAKAELEKVPLPSILAITLAKLGHAVGLLDADVYGPNVPLMMGIRADAACHRPAHSAAGSLWRAAHVDGFPEPRRQAAGVAWADAEFSVIQQFLRNVDWGQLDYLIIDLPPGTGDVQLTLIQTTPLTGAIIVTTPSDVALEDARKAVNMFEQVREPVLGIVENMSYLEHNGEKLYIFGKGGGARTAELMKVPLLAEIPLDPATREGGDAGQPITTREPSAQSKIFEQLARTVIDRAEATKQKQRPTITIAD